MKLANNKGLRDVLCGRVESGVARVGTDETRRRRCWGRRSRRPYWGGYRVKAIAQGQDGPIYEEELAGMQRTKYCMACSRGWLLEKTLVAPSRAKAVAATNPISVHKYVKLNRQVEQSLDAPPYISSSRRATCLLPYFYYSSAFLKKHG